MKVLVEDINIVLKSIKLSHSIQMSVCDADLEPLPPLQLFFLSELEGEEGGGRREEEDNNFVSGEVKYFLT